MTPLVTPDDVKNLCNPSGDDVTIHPNPTSTQTCNRCHHTAPLAELDLFHVFADIGVECKDRDACRRRAEAWNAENWVSPDGHDMKCESEFVSGAMAWSPCDCPARAADREEATQ